MTSNELLKKLHDHPFKPFRIRLVKSITYDVSAPWMLFVTESSAMVATETEKTDRDMTSRRIGRRFQFIT